MDVPGLINRYARTGGLSRAIPNAPDRLSRSVTLNNEQTTVSENKTANGKRLLKIACEIAVPTTVNGQAVAQQHIRPIQLVRPPEARSCFGGARLQARNCEKECPAANRLFHCRL